MWRVEMGEQSFKGPSTDPFHFNHPQGIVERLAEPCLFCRAVLRFMPFRCLSDGSLGLLT